MSLEKMFSAKLQLLKYFLLLKQFCSSGIINCAEKPNNKISSQTTNLPNLITLILLKHNYLRGKATTVTTAKYIERHQNTKKYSLAARGALTHCLQHRSPDGVWKGVSHRLIGTPNIGQLACVFPRAQLARLSQS